MKINRISKKEKLKHMWSLRIGLFMPRPNGFKDKARLEKIPVSEFKDKTDLLVFPEGYDEISEKERQENIFYYSTFARKRKIALILGMNIEDAGPQKLYAHELWFFSKKGDNFTVYKKHSNTEWSAWDTDVYDPAAALMTVPVYSNRSAKVIQVGMTLCHDHYIAPLQAYLVRTKKAQILINPSGDPSYPTLRKWTACQRARAIENSKKGKPVWSFATMWAGDSKPWGKLFGFGPTGDQVQFVPWRGTFKDAKPADSLSPDDLSRKNLPLWWTEIGPGAELGTTSKIIKYTSDLHGSQKKPKMNLKISASGAGLRIRNSRPLKWYPRGIIEAGHISNVGKILFLRMNSKELVDPIACWKRILLSTNNDTQRYLIWCRIDKDPKNELRWIAQSRALELCTPVIIHSQSSNKLWGYAIANQSSKYPAKKENAKTIDISFAFKIQGAGKKYALSPLTAMIKNAKRDPLWKAHFTKMVLSI